MRYVIKRSPGTSYILNRQRFIAQLRERSKRLGVVFCMGEKVKSIDRFDGDYIVDASGCPSTIKRLLDIPLRRVGLTYQQTLENSNCFLHGKIRMIFSGDFGYYWVFPRDPKKNEVNVGLGVFSHGKMRRLKEKLETFKEEHNIQGVVNHTTGGLIPLGLQPPFKYDNILFVGDAGVGSFPLTGEGIYRALISGDLASCCISRDTTKQYPYLVYRDFIKWDVIGSMIISMNLAARRIGPDAVYAVMNAFARGYSFLRGTT
ncbi:MAG: NAD(P)/FAD-dependent oxidoreductase [Candidatus Thermoplasmatota archaeon]